MSQIFFVVPYFIVLYIFIYIFRWLGVQWWCTRHGCTIWLFPNGSAICWWLSGNIPKILCNIIQTTPGYGTLKNVVRYFEECNVVLWRWQYAGGFQVTFIFPKYLLYSENTPGYFSKTLSYPFSESHFLFFCGLLLSSHHNRWVMETNLRYFEEGGMVLWRGWYGTLKRVMWYFGEGGMVMKTNIRFYFQVTLLFYVSFFHCSFIFYMNRFQMNTRQHTAQMQANSWQLERLALVWMVDLIDVV